jgi:monofunctional biosynthetic peptidoglycan transglycosylase
MGNGVWRSGSKKNIGIEKMPRFDTIQACRNSGNLPNPRKFTATSSSSYINNRKRKIMRDANGRENKILKYVKRHI